MAIYKFLFICVVIFSYLAAVPVYNTDEKKDVNLSPTMESFSLLVRAFQIKCLVQNFMCNILDVVL